MSVSAFQVRTQNRRREAQSFFVVLVKLSGVCAFNFTLFGRRWFVQVWAGG